MNLEDFFDIPEFEPEVLVRPRDARVDDCKANLVAFFDREKANVFYQQQIEVIFENDYFHWITTRALNELAAEKKILSDSVELEPKTSLKIYRHPSLRYWNRLALNLREVVRKFSNSEFSKAIGAHGELMVDAAFPTKGFLPVAFNVRSFNGKDWMKTGHNLDRIFTRDDRYYGMEIKNTLRYIPFDELHTKLEMCKHLDLIPLFVFRWAAKSYVELVRQADGFTLLLKYQLYPPGSHHLADEVSAKLRLPIGKAVRLEDGTVQRVLKWHLAELAKH